MSYHHFNDCFPQSNREWEDAAGYAIRKIKYIAPDLKILVNEYKFPIEDKGIGFKCRYGELFEPVDGVSLEVH